MARWRNTARVPAAAQRVRCRTIRDALCLCGINIAAVSLVADIDSAVWVGRVADGHGKDAATGLGPACCDARVDELCDEWRGVSGCGASSTADEITQRTDVSGVTP